MRRQPARRRIAVRARLLPLLLLALLQPGCAAMLRYKAARRDTPEFRQSTFELQKQMNPWLLTDLLADKLIVEIDWVEGVPPAPIAIEALEKRLREYGPAGRAFEIVLSDEIPRAEWEALHGGPGDIATLVARYLDSDPHPSREQTLAYVLYVPYHRRAKDRYFGQRESWGIERDGLPALVDGVTIFRESITKRRMLWITGDRIDRATLVHEFGHLFGLTSDYTHTAAKSPGHCTEVYCTMTIPSTRSYLANFAPGFFAARVPTDYCKKCRADMAEVKAYWEAQAAADTYYVDELQRRYDFRLAGRLYADWLHDRDGKGRERLTRAAMAHPTRAVYPLTLARIEASEGNREPALRLIDGTFATATAGERTQAARQLCALGEYADALKFLALAEQTPTAFVDEDAAVERIDLRIWAYEGLGRLAEALTEEEARAELEATRYGSQVGGRIHLLTRLGKWDEARALIESAPKGMDRSLLLGRLWRARGDDTLAGASFRESLESNRRRLESIPEKDDPVTRHRRGHAIVTLAEIHAELGDETAAREAVESLSGLFSKGNAALISMTRARVLTILGDGDGALEALTGLSLPIYSAQDPCVVFGGTTLAADPRFRERYPWCAEGSDPD